jgi:hypothetical protein
MFETKYEIEWHYTHGLMCQWNGSVQLNFMLNQLL